MTDRPKTRSGRKASQMTFEIESFKRLLSERGVTRYLEIGARIKALIAGIKASREAASP